MNFKFTCLRCSKIWHREILMQLDFVIEGSITTFCGSCRKQMTKEFEKQLYVKKIRTEEKN